MPAYRATKNESGFLWTNVFVGPEDGFKLLPIAHVFRQTAHFGGSCARTTRGYGARKVEEFMLL